MTQDVIKSLTDADLAQVILWGQVEVKARTERRKQETIAKIKELAGAVGVTVAIRGQRGRPVAAKEPNHRKDEGPDWGLLVSRYLEKSRSINIKKGGC
jgi:hypothetical protein